MASVGNPYVPSVTFFRNSSEFSYLANYFRENKCYTKLPEGTIDYKEFWKEVKKYCLEGFTNSKGIYITGKHFFYLNFVQIDKQEDEDTNPNKSKKPGRKRKSKDFPRFVDLDYDYFHMLNYCEEYQKSELAVKGRRQGWSYKAGSVVAHEFTFLKDSKCIISAYLEKYSANTMKFVLDNLNFLAKNTPFGHIRNPDTKDFIQARYMKDLGGIKVWEGYNSSVASLTFNNSYESAVGLSADKFIIDEAGLFPSIIEAYGYTEPLIKDGNEYTGMALIFGSSGEIEKAEPFMKMFMNPDTYNFLKFYDPNGKETAYFSPAYRGRWGKCRDPKSKYYNQELVDKDGNSMEQAAIDDILWEREILKKGSDRQRYHKFITQYPIKWEEAFLRAGQTIFPTIEIADWLSVLETNKNVAPPVTVDLYFDSENKIQYRLNDDEYITEFPLQRQDKKGAVAIFEFPEITNNDIPFGLYIAGCLTPGEKVLTNTGLKNVEDVKLVDKLINKDGDLVKIKSLQKYLKKEEDTYKLSISNTYRTTNFTKEHPIYISDNCYNTNKTINEEAFKFEFKTVDRVKIGDWTKVPNTYLKLQEIDLNEKWSNTTYRTDRQIENPLLNEDFWWLVGLWLGDGWCDNNEYRINISFNSKETFYIEKFINVVNNIFGRQVYCNKTKAVNCIECSFSFQQLNRFLTLNFGKYAYGKEIPEWVKYLPKNLKKHLILGYLNSDGCISKNNNSYTSEFISINLNLLESIQDILFSLGIISGLSKLRDPSIMKMPTGKIYKTRTCYNLRLNHHDTLLLHKLIYTKGDHKLDRVDLNNLPKKRKRPKDGCFFSEDFKYIYFQIRAIEKSTYSGFVYNFECDTNTFMCHHITTHNCDPYDHDQAGSSSSLGSFFIYKRFYRADKTHDILVAEYTGRPEMADDFYENCRRLCIFYNAKCLYENQLKGLKAYFEKKHSLHYLYNTPNILKDIIKDSVVTRTYGIHMNQTIKRQLEIYTKQWLLTERTESDGRKILNLHTIKSPALLKELLLYDGELNTDRIISVMLCILQSKELENINIVEESTNYKPDPFWSKPLYSKNNNINNFML